MARYLVKFFKNVENDTGHMADVCQGWFDIVGASKETVLADAKRQFCQRDGLSSWSLHADRFEIDEADFPS